MSAAGTLSDGTGGDLWPTQAEHLLAIDSGLGPDALLLTALDGVESISRGFVYTIEMLTAAPDAEVRTLLGRPVTLWICNASETGRRPLHGHVRRLTTLSVDSRGYRRWRAEMVPWMWFLTRSQDCRIYQNLTIPEILRSVFDDHGLTHYELRLFGQYPKLEFCVQYRETGFAFVSRLMEHIGIFYWFEHHPDRHLLVLADNNIAAHFTTPAEARLSMREDLGEIQELTHDCAFQTGKWALNDFDFEVPTKNLRTSRNTVLDNTLMKRFEIYEYPGDYTHCDRGQELTRLRMEGEEARHYQISGVGSCPGFDAGRKFTLAEGGGDKQQSWLLTEVRHTAREPGYFSASREAATYGNRFAAIPAETPFRPERLTPKPIVEGPQTATVVGPAGENIHTDEYGRVRLLFHWDRRGTRDEHASCWIRVSQHAAGSHWGGLAVPHVGQEVIVSFLEGDPDRPIVTGRVHNAMNMPPVMLPRDKNKTVLRDHGDNRIVMHGKAGHERLSLVSPKNINFVAMRRPAKGLSAQTIDGVEFDDYNDGGSLQELFNVYQQLVKQQTPAGFPAQQSDGNPTGNVYAGDDFPIPGSKPPTAQTVPEGADLATNVDINSLSEHDINSLSVNNTNNWVGGAANTWVKGDMNQEVVGNTDTVSHGTVTNTYRGHFVRDTVDVLHEEETTLHNEFTGVHTEAAGLHLEDTLLHFEFHTGLHVEGHLPDSCHIDLNETVSVENLASRVSSIESEISNIETKISDVAVKIEKVKSYNLEAHDFNLTADVAIIQINNSLALNGKDLIVQGKLIALG